MDKDARVVPAEQEARAGPTEQEATRVEWLWSGLWSGLSGLPDWIRLCNSLQELHKLPKCQVLQPPHSPPVEGLLKGTFEEVLEGRIVVPQALGCSTEPQGKLPHISSLLTEGAQGLKLEDALVEGAAER